MLSTSIFECAEAYSLVAPEKNDDYHTFFQPPFPTLPMPQTMMLLYSLSQKYPEPIAFGEADLRLVLASPRLAAL